MMLSKRIVIIGNGIAGFSAAAAVRRLSDRAEITMISVETESLYSPCVLPEYISGRIRRENTYVNTPGDYDRLGVKILFGQKVEEVEPGAARVWLEKGKNLSFDRLVLAVGSRAIEIGDRKKGSFVVKSLADADALIGHRGRKAVVVGSGAIGIEVAVALKTRGYDAEVLEGLPRILPLALDQKAADIVKKILEDNGIRVAVQERATAAVGAEKIEGLKTDRRELECDTIVWAIGMKPNIELARDAGVRIGIKGGIAVDSHMETNVEGVYACGDCVETNDIGTGRPALNLFWHNANRQGAVAGCNSLGLNLEYPGSESLLNMNVFGNHVVGFGQTVAGLEELGVKPEGISIIEREEASHYHRLVFVENRCLGAQFINPGKETGLVWGLIRQGRKVDKLLNLFEKEETSTRKAWLSRLRPLFWGKEFVRL